MPHRLPHSRPIAVLAAVTVTLIAVAVTLLLWQMRQRALQQSRAQTVAFAHMLREQTERTFDSADQVLRGVQERMQTSFGEQLPLDAPAVRLLLGSRALGAPHVDVVAIADAAGRIVNASRADPALAESIAGAGYFQALLDGAAGLQLGGPVRNDAGDWMLDFARPLVDSRGRLRGVVVLTMKVPRMDASARPVALYLADGTLVASAPPRDDAMGRAAPELAGQPLPPPAGAGMLAVAFGDGGGRELALVRAAAFPLLVAATVDNAPALAAWREQAMPIVMGALLVCVFTIGSGCVLAAHLQREAQLARELRALSSSLQDVREQERSRIAAELHDELGQQLTGLKLELSWLAARVKDGRALATGNVDGMRQQLDASIASVRRIATELRPRVLDDLGFGAAVAGHAREFARRSGIAVALDLDAADRVRDSATATALFRIVQESLTNVARHAQARHVGVSLQAQDGWAVLRIEDDGRGFEPGARDRRGIGLVGMRERALAVGARLAITSTPGRGTAIEVRLPLVEADAGQEEIAA